MRNCSGCPTESAESAHRIAAQHSIAHSLDPRAESVAVGHQTEKCLERLFSSSLSGPGTDSSFPFGAKRLI